MIVFGKTQEPKVASATSTYLAVISYVEPVISGGSGLRKLSFYCPATMSGKPMEAVYNGSNIVEAPIKPHNDAEDYDFQVGGVIAISYADGNLNTPQFVRYISVTEDVIAHNKAILSGSEVPADESVNIDYTRVKADILSSERLAKAVILMPALKICASNNNKDFYYTFVEGANLPTQDRAYTKAGLYGSEFLCEDFPDNIFSNSSEWDFVTSYSNNRRLATRHQFMNICAYLITDSAKVSTVKPEAIVTALQRSKLRGVKNITSISHPLAAYIFVAVAGLPTTLDKFNEQVGKIYPAGSSDEDAYNAKIVENSCKGSTYQLSDDIKYIYRKTGSEDKIKYSSLWNSFCDIYSKELEKCYACILNDNLQSIALKFNLTKWDNVMFAIMAIVATAWPLLENSIIGNDGAIFDKDSASAKFYDKVKGYLKENKTSSFYSNTVRKAIGDGYAAAFVEIMTKDWGTTMSAVPDSLKKMISEYIVKAINYLISNWSSISTTLAKTADTNNGTGAGAGFGQGSTDEEKIWNSLMVICGNNAYAAAGVMGNMNAESGLRPNNLADDVSSYTDESYTRAVDNGSYTRNQFTHDGWGYGLVQWTFWTVKQGLYDYAKQQKKSIGDLMTQLGYLKIQLDKGEDLLHGLLDKLKKSKSVREASDLFLYNYERPADQSSAHAAKRASMGQTFYNKYAHRTNVGASGSFQNPLAGQWYQVTSEFGPRPSMGDYHYGIDLGANRNTPIKAAMSGRVVTATSHSSYGNYIMIDHGNGKKTVYAHQDHFASGISVGVQVSQGQVIGYVDTTGNSTGNHLHFEIRINGECKNPRNYLKF